MFSFRAVFQMQNCLCLATLLNFLFVFLFLFFYSLTDQEFQEDSKSVFFSKKKSSQNLHRHMYTIFISQYINQRHSSQLIVRFFELILRIQFPVKHLNDIVCMTHELFGNFFSIFCNNLDGSFSVADCQVFRHVTVGVWDTLHTAFIYRILIQRHHHNVTSRGWLPTVDGCRSCSVGYLVSLRSLFH